MEPLRVAAFHVPQAGPRPGGEGSPRAATEGLRARAHRLIDAAAAGPGEPPGGDARLKTAVDAWLARTMEAPASIPSISLVDGGRLRAEEAMRRWEAAPGTLRVAAAAGPLSATHEAGVARALAPVLRGRAGQGEAHLVLAEVELPFTAEETGRLAALFDLTDPTFQGIVQGTVKGREALAWLKARHPELLYYHGHPRRMEWIAPRQPRWRLSEPVLERYPDLRPVAQAHPDGFPDGDPAVCATEHFDVAIWMPLMGDHPKDYYAFPEGDVRFETTQAALDEVARSDRTVYVHVLDPADFEVFHGPVPAGYPVPLIRTPEYRAYHVLRPLLVIEATVADLPGTVFPFDEGYAAAPLRIGGAEGGSGGRSARAGQVQ